MDGEYEGRNDSEGELDGREDGATDGASDSEGKLDGDEDGAIGDFLDPFFVLPFSLDPLEDDGASEASGDGNEDGATEGVGANESVGAMEGASEQKKDCTKEYNRLDKGENKLLMQRRTAVLPELMTSHSFCYFCYS